MTPLHSSRNQVIAASAGTGKTHVLVGTMLHALLGLRADSQRKVLPARVLATTFSRRAATELRERLHRSLAQLVSEPSASPYYEGLSRYAGDARLSKLAREVSHTVDELVITTIHGLAAHLLTQHGDQGEFEIIPEHAAKRLLRNAVREAMERLAHADADALHLTFGRVRDPLRLEDELTSFLASTPLRRFLPVDESEAIAARFRELRRIVSQLRQPGFDAGKTAFLAGVREGDEARWREGLRLLQEVRKSASAEGAELEFAEFFYEPGKKAERAERFAELVRWGPTFAPIARVLAMLLEDAARIFRRDTSDLGRLTFDQLEEVCLDQLERVDAFREAAQRAYDMLLVDEFQDTSPRQGALLRHLWAEAGPASTGVVPPFSSLRRHGLVIVGDRKQSIYGFRGADVSVFAEFAVALAGAPARRALGLGEGMLPEPSDPSADFSALSINRRSDAPILDVVNQACRHLFTTDASPLPFEVVYAPETEDLQPVPQRPDVSMVPSASNPGTPADARARALANMLAAEPEQALWLRAPLGEDERATTREQDAQVVASEIARIHRTYGVPLSAFGVLVITNEMVDTCGAALSALGLPFQSDTGGLFRATEVRDLRAMLAALRDPKDSLALLEVLRSSWVGLSDTSLARLALLGRGAESGVPRLVAPDSPEALGLLDEDERAPYRAFVTCLSEARRLVDRVAPAELLRVLRHELDLNQVLSALPQGAQRARNVEKALTMLRGMSHVDEAIEYLDQGLRELRESEEAGQGEDSVHVLTVHGSKGLSFPIVIVPQAGAVPQTPRRPVLVRPPFVPTEATRVPLSFRVRGRSLFVRTSKDGSVDAEIVSASISPPTARLWELEQTRRERAERQRLLYVALTRAERFLFFVGNRAFSKSGESATPDLARSVLAPLHDAGRLVAIEPKTRALASTAKAGPAAGMPMPPSSSAPATATLPAEGSGSTPRRQEQDDDTGRPLTLSALVLAPTALADFAHCPRRFALIHVLDVREERPSFGDQAARLSAREPQRRQLSLLDIAAAPNPEEELASSVAVDVRHEGTAMHRVLETTPISAWGHPERDAPATPGPQIEIAKQALLREGVSQERVAQLAERIVMFWRSAYARAVVERRAEVLRELPFSLEVVLARGGRCLLRGTIDLVVRYPDGSLDVIDYKRARGRDVTKHACQLEIYRAAASARFGGPVRAGISFLGGDPEPVFLADPDGEALAGSLGAIAQALVDARASGNFSRVDLAECRALRCGYVPRCHG